MAARRSAVPPADRRAEAVPRALGALPGLASAVAALRDPKHAFGLVDVLRRGAGGGVAAEGVPGAVLVQPHVVHCHRGRQEDGGVPGDAGGQAHADRHVQRLKGHVPAPCGRGEGVGAAGRSFAGNKKKQTVPEHGFFKNDCV